MSALILSRESESSARSAASRFSHVKLTGTFEADADKRSSRLSRWRVKTKPKPVSDQYEDDVPPRKPKRPASSSENDVEAVEEKTPEPKGKKKGKRQQKKPLRRRYCLS